MSSGGQPQGLPTGRPSPSAAPSGWAAVRGPLVVLGLGALVFFEPVLPARDTIVRHLGETAVLRFAVLGLCLFTALLLLERHRTTGMLRELLGELQRLSNARAAGGVGAAGAEAGVSPADQDAAIEILIAALESDDESVRDAAHRHLCRLTGEDHGLDPAAWRRTRGGEEA